MELWIDAISKLGFPITSAVFCALTLLQIGRWAMRRGDRLLNRIESHLDESETAFQTIKPQLDRIESGSACRAPGLVPHSTPRTA